MTGIVIRRALAAVPLLFVVSVMAFLLMKAVPGDPVDVLIGNAERDLSPGQALALRREMGLTRPWPRQYLNWVAGWWGAGELGRSYKDGRPVACVIAERCPTTLLLVGSAVALAFAGGITLGTAMAVLSWSSLGRLLERACAVAALLLYSAPTFWLAFLAIFAVERWLPGWPILGPHRAGSGDQLGDALQHVVLPALLLASRKAAKIALFVRAQVLDEMGREYVLVARSKGLSKTAVVARHIFRNTMPPVISLLGLSLPALFGGSVLIETVFGWPGIGRLAVDATFGRNYPVILALIVVYGAIVVASNLVADVLSCLADPRVREQAMAPGTRPAPGGTGAA